MKQIELRAAVKRGLTVAAIVALVEALVVVVAFVFVPISIWLPMLGLWPIVVGLIVAGMAYKAKLEIDERWLRRSILAASGTLVAAGVAIFAYWLALPMLGSIAFYALIGLQLLSWVLFARHSRTIAR